MVAAPWTIVYTKQAQKDAKKLSAAGLKDAALNLLELIRIDPFQNPPRFEKLVGDLSDAYSRRIKYQAPARLPGTRKRKNCQGASDVDAF